jgi:long-chain fatty acid transport protein
MKIWMAASAAILAATAVASAGGVERSSQSVGILFQEGTFAELSFAIVNPDVSGTQLVDVPSTGSLTGATSGDMTPSYNQFSLSYRQDLTEQLSFAFIMDEHIGADVNYVGTGTPFVGYLYNSGAGSQATIDGQAFTALLRYELPSAVSIYGGLRISQLEGNVSLFNFYTLQADGGTEVGYVLGVAYERPDIALRIALTYGSAIDHTFTGTEASPLISVNEPQVPFETTIPQSLTLEFQSGVAANTLVFGSIRWVDWTEFDVSPTNFGSIAGGSSLSYYENDTITYNIGVGRRLNETWSGSLSLTHEPSGGGFFGNLGPTDGRSSVAVAAVYERGAIKVTGGVSYSWIGDATTQAPGPSETSFGSFTDNTSIAAGVRIGYQF